MIEILNPGPLASIQDKGRFGHYAIGVGCSGAMDPLALAIGNRLVGNPEGHAAIEFTIGGFTVRFAQDIVIALTGADCFATLDGMEIPSFWCVKARAGQVLKAAAPRWGMRTYLAVAGGFAIEPVMASRSTDLKGGFGGLAGRALQAGDNLEVDEAPPMTDVDFGLAAQAMKSFYDIRYPDDLTVRFIRAAEHDAFAVEAASSFCQSAWTILPDSNRIGYRLSGDKLELQRKLELRSHGIIPGTIQVPPSGQPVIQMSDANTCGGYPKIGAVIGCDLWRLAQARLGSTVRFSEVDRDLAVDLADKQERDLSGFLNRVADMRGALR
jgi:5-oxoprolinase (ATP-hydrolysing) subunit C